MKGRSNRWQHRLNREHPTCTERWKAHSECGWKGGDKMRLGVQNRVTSARRWTCPHHRKKRVDTDRPSHGRAMHSLSTDSPISNEKTFLYLPIRLSFAQSRVIGNFALNFPITPFCGSYELAGLFPSCRQTAQRQEKTLVRVMSAMAM